MIELFQDIFLPEMVFLRYALLMGLLASPVLGIIGTLVVTRRISSLAGSSAHAALGGVGVALYLQRVWQISWSTPTLGAVAGALAAALLVGVVSLTAREREDTVIAVVWALGMSIGLLFLDKTPGYVDWQGYLFGNILLLSESDLYFTAGLDLVVLVPILLFYNPVLTMLFDDTFATLRGVRSGVVYLILLGLTALTIVQLINVVGIILVLALLTLPAATAGCVTRHLWSMMVLGMVLSWLFVTAGLLGSYFFRVPSGPAIVVLAGTVYLIALGIRRLTGSRG